MSFNPEIRALTDTDLSSLLALYEHHLFDTPDTPSPEGSTLKAAWEEIIGNPRITCFGLFCDSELISSCIMVIVPNLTRGASPYGLIENVVTHRAHRRKGLAALMLEEALNHAWQAGCYKVMLLSSNHRNAAHGLYKKVGFSADQKIGFVAKAPVEQ